MPTGEQIGNSLDIFVTRLRKPHEVSVYEAIERLVQVGEAVGPMHALCPGCSIRA